MKTHVIDRNRLQSFLGYAPGIVFIVFVSVVALMATRNYLSYKTDAKADWVTGEQASLFEQYYDDRLPIKDIGINSWALVDYLVFKEGREGVVVAHDDWLYTQEEFKRYLGSDNYTQENETVVLAVNNLLKRNNVELLMLPLPDKARVYPEFVPWKKRSEIKSDRYNDFIGWMGQEQINHISTLHKLVESKQEKHTFLRTDTHWTAWGAMKVAELLALNVRAEWPHLADDKSYTYVKEKELLYTGDLMDFIPLGDYLSWIGPPPEYINIYKTEVASSDAELDLFGDSELPSIALVGTSYSANKTWHFSGFIQSLLNADVLNVSKEGRGPLEPMVDYLTSKDFEEHKPELILWEFPERYLPMATSLAVYDWAREIN